MLCTLHWLTQYHTLNNYLYLCQGLFIWSGLYIDLNFWFCVTLEHMLFSILPWSGSCYVYVCWVHIAQAPYRPMSPLTLEQSNFRLLIVSMPFSIVPCQFVNNPNTYCCIFLLAHQLLLQLFVMLSTLLIIMLRFIDAVVVGGWHADNPLCCHMASRYATAPFCEKERSLECDGLVLCVISFLFGSYWFYWPMASAA